MFSDSGRNKHSHMSSDGSSSCCSRSSWYQGHQEYLDQRFFMPASNKNSKQMPADFYMYEFKVYPCSKGYAHDWTTCPFYHPDERSRRRDLRRFPYSCIQCMEFRKAKSCPKGDHCEFAHGTFETWLHPGLYKTKVCRDRENCRKKLCFFAHSADELRPIYRTTGCALQTHVGSSYRIQDVAFASTGSLETSSSNVGSPHATDSHFHVDDWILENSDIGNMYRLQEAQLIEALHSQGSGIGDNNLGAGNPGKLRMQLGYAYEESPTNSEHQQSMYNMILNQRSHPSPLSFSAHLGWLQNSGLQPRPRNFLSRETVRSNNAASALKPFAPPFSNYTGGHSLANI